MVDFINFEWKFAIKVESNTAVRTVLDFQLMACRL